MFLKDMNGYLGTQKIKSMYLGNSLVYQDSKPNGLYFLKFGDTQLTQKKIVPIKFIETNGEVIFLEFGNSTTTTHIITPYKYQTTSQLKFLKLEVN